MAEIFEQEGAGSYPQNIDSIVPHENIDPRCTFAVEDNSEKSPVWVRLNAELAGAYYDNLRAELESSEVDSATRTGLEQALAREGQVCPVEGIIHQPKEPNGTLIIFTPGLPGDANVWFEKKHLSLLLEQGYTVLALRHIGTKTKSGVYVDENKTIDKSSVYINCEKRRDIGEQIGGGNEEHTLEEMALEGAVAVNAIGQNFNDIKFVNHSAGAIHTLYDIASGAINEEHLSKISSIVNLAGYLGGDDEKYRSFTPSAYYEWCKQFINMGDANTNSALVQRMFKKVYDNPSAIPGSAMVISVNPKGDEYVMLAGAENFQQALKRGLVIDDHTQDPSVFGGERHDFGNFPFETFLRLLQMQYPKRRHKFSVGREGNPFRATEA